MRPVAVCEVGPHDHALPARILDGERDALIVALRDGELERVVRVELGARGDLAPDGWHGLRRTDGALTLRSPEGRVFVIDAAEFGR